MDNSQVLLDIYQLVMCTSLVLLNAPLVVKFYIIMSIRKMKVRREETMFCHI